MTKLLGAYEVLSHDTFRVRHGFTTRRSGAGSALGLGGDIGDLARAAGFVEHRILEQVHGARVVRAESVVSGAEADAVITDRRGILLCVQSADCVPILLYDPAAPAVGAVHAGWRGTAQRIASAAVEAMRAAYGSRSDRLFALLGPAIGPCCYEVGREVREALERASPGAGAVAGVGRHGGETVNLWRANRLILQDAGLRPERILLVNRCTSCHAHLFPSFRRDGAGCGRMVSFVGMEL